MNFPQNVLMNAARLSAMHASAAAKSGLTVASLKDAKSLTAETPQVRHVTVRAAYLPSTDTSEASSISFASLPRTLLAARHARPCEDPSHASHEAVQRPVMMA